MTTPAAVRAFEHHLVTYKRVWRGTVFLSFVAPLLYLTAMGLGLGTIVDTNETLGAVPYKTFIAPGLLAASAMQLGAQESMWPVMAAFRWTRIYFAEAATPLRPADAALGHLLFITFRIALTSVLFFLVMLAFGTVDSPWGLLAPAVATLCGVAHAAPVMAFSATRETEGTAFSAFNRFVIIPLFLFGGTFFPITQLPAVLRPIAYVTPLWNGVSLCRSLTLGHPSAPGAVAHLAVMTAWTVAGVAAAVPVYRRRLGR